MVHLVCRCLEVEQPSGVLVEACLEQGQVAVCQVLADCHHCQMGDLTVEDGPVFLALELAAQVAGCLLPLLAGLFGVASDQTLVCSALVALVVVVLSLPALRSNPLGVQLIQQVPGEQYQPG